MNLKLRYHMYQWTMEVPIWKFRYRSYRKQRVIQFKPYHDAENHFSVIWSKGKKLSVEDFEAIDDKIRSFIENNGNELTFTILRACTNCTYGRFDQEFEDLILELRKTYSDVCKIKDLTLDDPKHTDLKPLVIWDENHPIIHHIHCRSETGNAEIDLQWESLFRGPHKAEDISKGLLFGTKIRLVFEI